MGGGAPAVGGTSRRRLSAHAHSVGPVSFGNSVRLSTGRRSRPGAFSVTWLEAPTEAERARVRARTRAMFGDRFGNIVSTVAMWSLFLLALFVWPGLFAWVVIVFFVAGRGTPPLNDIKRAKIRILVEAFMNRTEPSA